MRGVLADGVTEAEIDIPSGSLQLNKPFEVTPGEVTTFVYDISVVSAGPGSGDVKYLIRPVIGESGSDQGFSEVESDKSRKPEATGDKGKGDDAGKPTATPTPAPASTATATPTPEPTSTPTPTATPDALGAEFFLDVLSPLDGDISDTQTVVVIGRTRIDAFVSVNDELPEPDENGRFEATVALEEGPNFIEIVASIDDEQLGIVIPVI